MNKKTQAFSISIVIPVFNDQDHLKNCLDSIKQQTVLPDEVIVVDNNCTDGSMAIAKKYPFVHIVSEKKQGVQYARNRGFNVATSIVIGRIDADTQLPKDWIERIQTIFTQTSIAAVSGPVGWHDAPAKQLGFFIDKSVRRVVWHLGERDNAVFLFGSNMAVRKDAWKAVKNDVCMRKDVHEDVDLAIHLFKAGYDVAFDGGLDAMTSSRRINDSAEQLKKYIAVYKNTYEIHGIRNPGIVLAMKVPLTAHFTVKLIKRAYNSETGRFSFKKFLETESEPRVHPMG